MFDTEAPMSIVAGCVAYVAISVAAIIWVARTLGCNGRGLLIDAFHGEGELADSVNLLVAGFHLINVGCVALALRTADPAPSLRSALELVCNKLGVVLIVLGAMHFFNLYIFHRLRKRELAELRQPPPPGARSSIRLED